MYYYSRCKVRKFSMKKVGYIIITILMMVPALIFRTKINEWFYNDVIRIIPEFVWKPLDIFFAIVWYSLIAYAIYMMIQEHKENKEGIEK